MFRHSLILMALFATAALSRAGADSFFEQKVHDFGATPRGPQLVHYFRYTNTSKETVTVRNVRVSCGCVTASSPVTQVKPGETSYITASMDSRRFSGPRTVTIYVELLTPNYEEVSLSVTANGRDDFSMTPDTLAFGAIRRGSEAKGSVQLTLQNDPNWAIKDVVAESNYIKPSYKLIKRGNGEVTFEVSASPRKDLPVGKWYTDVWVNTNNPNIAKVRVPLTIEVSAPVTATPAAPVLGEIKMGDSSEQAVLLKSDRAFKIKSVKGTDDVVSVSGVGAEAKAIHVIRVNVKPNRMGEISRDLSFVLDGEEPIVVPVRAMAVKSDVTANK